ncbi:protein kinase [Nocardia sp. NPDC058058]|uniref:serine/threonine-protein kinase n=1 Tax=Nocardia sp. NPDC058058 TaxID=3346317 RepID=UPI0036DADACB
MRLDPGAVFAGYTIERMLGHGGMGIVYAARHPRLDRLVALKVLNEAVSGDTRARARFEREAALAARLEHANIVPIYDRADSAAEIPWICMKYVGGGDISLLMATRRGPLPPDEAVRLITDAARGLDHAHRYGIIHRDIKPANILIDRAEHDEGRALLTDFGIARAFDDTLTVTSISATFAYAAPERFGSTPADHRADIYSLGCTFYEILTARTPFPRPDQAAVIAAHLSAPPPRPTDLNPSLPPGLDEVIATALAKSPDDRYPTSTALAEAAQRALTLAPRPAVAPTPDSRTAPTTISPAAAGFDSTTPPPNPAGWRPRTPPPQSISPVHAEHAESTSTKPSVPMTAPRAAPTPEMIETEADRTALAPNPRTAPTAAAPARSELNSVPLQQNTSGQHESRSSGHPDPHSSHASGSGDSTEQRSSASAELPADAESAGLPARGAIPGWRRHGARITTALSWLSLLIGAGLLRDGAHMTFADLYLPGNPHQFNDVNDYLFKSGWYLTVLEVASIILCIFTLMSRVHRPTRQAVVAGFAVWSVWGAWLLAQLADWINHSTPTVDASTGYRFLLAGHISIALAGLWALSTLVLEFWGPSMRATLDVRLPRDPFTIATMLVGSVGWAASVLIPVVLASKVEFLNWQRGPQVAAAILFGCIPVFSAMLLPRRLFSAITVGWGLGAGVLCVLFYTMTVYGPYEGVFDSRLTVPGIFAFTVVAILVINLIDLRRAARREIAT